MSKEDRFKGLSKKTVINLLFCMVFILMRVLGVKDLHSKR
ncbi:hypothetical protein LTSEINV_1405 [Salmonella enterica subsp. enterica serovar Inverness str. R8-3668]|uniref:Uncharacterized protein n=1 Tax=Salmonella enterica subsp. enterica serovar Inverness str. R8-3668 TaxID=913075 RepID=G5NAC8_SALET|nr:hypothetical protein LTSEINV_1405 [Salmonella enterica subsp. enterica serovar Inverness str. R8-3668]